MRAFFTVALSLLIATVAGYGQAGTPGDPFTELAQAQTVGSPGVYYFDLEGTTFFTYVLLDGYVMVAIDFGNGNGALPQSTSLTQSNRAVLTPAALSKLSATETIRMTISTGILDATTTNANMIGRMVNNLTLMNSTAHNADNDDWVGTGQSNLRRNASGAQAEVALGVEVYHTFGDGGGVHWFPQRGDQALTFGNEIANGETIRLYARAADFVGPPGSPSNPFTQLADARTVAAAGEYSFDLNGTVFRTYVDINGYVQVARDVGNGVGTLPAAITLSRSSRGILTAGALASLTDADEVRFTTSVPNTLDAVSFEQAYLDRVVAGQALMFDSKDNTLNDSWSGTGEEFLQVDATFDRGARPDLATEVYHTFGDGRGMTWFPGRDDQAFRFEDGNIADGESLTLWVRAPDPNPPGSAANPFTSLFDAAAVTSPGRYFFVLNGQTFDTYVDEQGWVRLALDYRNASGALPQSKSPPEASEGILDAAALASLTEMTEVRISSSVPNFLDARTSNTGVFNKVLANQPIKSDHRDNAINTEWTGTGSDEVNKLAGPGQINDIYTSLNEEIYHNFFGPNQGEGLHWIPSRGDMSLKFEEDIAAGESFMLWARARPAGLPLLLHRFTAAQDRADVAVFWEVYAANGGEFIDIEYSQDAVGWVRLDRTPLGPGGGQQLHSFRHQSPPAGSIHYYRLRQRDYDGTDHYSSVVSVDFASVRAGPLAPYPNPATDRITLSVGSATEDPVILNTAGHRVGAQARVLSRTATTVTLDVSQLGRGMYYVQWQNGTRRFVKH